ncbi:MAG: transporter substrate-binding domain-containing protein [Propionibacteriaceae bacterium]|nr:transporter substrate-binding domain-containing protein [Propionibacteriaceae bacterium]
MTHRTIRIPRWTALAVIPLAALALASCSTSSTNSSESSSPSSNAITPNSQTIKSVADLNGLVAASIPTAVELTPDSFERAFKVRPSEVLTFPTMADNLAAVKSGRADFTENLMATLDYYTSTDPTLASIAFDEQPFSVTMLARDTDSDVLIRVNDAITQLQSSGRIDELVQTYITDVDPTTIGDLPTPSPTVTEGQTITVGVSGDNPPIDYVSADGQPAGFNVALMTEIANLAGWQVEFEVIPFESKFSALTSDRVDLFFFHGGFQQVDGTAATEAYLTDVQGGFLIRK